MRSIAGGAGASDAGLRRYGETDAPGAFKSYSMLNMTADVIGLLDVRQEEMAAVVTDDQDAHITWNRPVAAARGTMINTAGTTTRAPRYPRLFVYVTVDRRTCCIYSAVQVHEPIFRLIADRLIRYNFIRN